MTEMRFYEPADGALMTHGRCPSVRVMDFGNGLKIRMQCQIVTPHVGLRAHFSGDSGLRFEWSDEDARAEGYRPPAEESRP